MMNKSRVLKVHSWPKGKEIKETLQIRRTKTSPISNVQTPIAARMAIALKSVGQRVEARKVRGENRIKGRKRVKRMSQQLLQKTAKNCLHLPALLTT